jgi:hypothetical protein
MDFGRDSIRLKKLKERLKEYQEILKNDHNNREWMTKKKDTDTARYSV